MLEQGAHLQLVHGRRVGVVLADESERGDHYGRRDAGGLHGDAELPIEMAENRSFLTCQSSSVACDVEHEAASASSSSFFIILLLDAGRRARAGAAAMMIVTRPLDCYILQYVIYNFLLP